MLGFQPRPGSVTLIGSSEKPFPLGHSTPLLLCILTTLFSQTARLTTRERSEERFCRRHPAATSTCLITQSSRHTKSPYFFLFGLCSGILIVSCGRPSGFYRPGVRAGTPALENEKHFPWVWQLEQNKRLLFASCPSASHNTQLTAWSFLIHSQELGVPRIRDINMASSAAFSPHVW